MNPTRSNPLWGYLLLSLFWVAVCGVIWFVVQRPAPQPLEILPAPTLLPTSVPSPPSPLPPSATPPPLHVDVAGAVQSPGVFRLPPGSIVADALAAAGGPLPDAALDRLNKAASLKDGMQVYLPRMTETLVPAPLLPQISAGDGVPEPAVMGTRPASGARDKRSPALQSVDINYGTVEELETLPGIGPSMAQRIIAGRPYSNTDDLLRVDGIGPLNLARFKLYILVR